MKNKDEVLAICYLIEQYCPKYNYENMQTKEYDNVYDHQCISAGEHAFRLLKKYGLHTNGGCDDARFIKVEDLDAFIERIESEEGEG